MKLPQFDNSQKRVTARMNVNNCEVVFQLGSAADVNTICQKYVKMEQVQRRRNMFWSGGGGHRSKRALDI